jgi:hypothetical protein
MNDPAGDVGVVAAWAWPNPLEGVSTADLPELCRGGSKSLTFQEVESHWPAVKHTKGNFIDG